jgi:hypothetical protein
VYIWAEFLLNLFGEAELRPANIGRYRITKVVSEFVGYVTDAKN